MPSYFSFLKQIMFKNLCLCSHPQRVPPSVMRIFLSRIIDHLCQATAAASDSHFNKHTKEAEQN